MNALSKLLAKVAIRAIKKSNTESELLAVGNQVITWQPLILETHIEAIANSMEEDVADASVEETATETPVEEGEPEVIGE